MKKTTSTYLANTFGLIIPVSLIQLYLINEQWLPYLLIAFVSAVILFGSMFVYGLSKRYKGLLYAFPIYILVTIGTLVLVQYQNKISLKTADELIVLIEKYRRENGRYPVSLDDLKIKYINDVPKNWRGFIPSDYLYYFNSLRNSFSLTQEFGKQGGRVWQSSNGSWDYYGD